MHHNNSNDNCLLTTLVKIELLFSHHVDNDEQIDLRIVHGEFDENSSRETVSPLEMPHLLNSISECVKVSLQVNLKINFNFIQQKGMSDRTNFRMKNY